MGKVKGQMLDMVSDPGQSLYPHGPGEGVCCKGHRDSRKEPFGDKVTTSRVGQFDGTDVVSGHELKQLLENSGLSSSLTSVFPARPRRAFLILPPFAADDVSAYRVFGGS